MKQHTIEVLYTKNKVNDYDIKKTFESSISSYLKNSELQYEVENKLYRFEYNSILLDDSLFVSVKQYPKTAVSKLEIGILQKLNRELKISASKVFLSSTTLSDDTSLFFIEKLIPHIHKYEWALRKLIYLMLRRNFKEKWIEKSIPEEDIKDIKKRNKGAYDESNILQEVTLYHLENYLFGENYIFVKENSGESYTINFNELDSSFLIELLRDSDTSSSSPTSLWNQHFDKYLGKESPEIESDVGEIRMARNIVGHNKEVKESQYEKWMNSLQKIIKELEVIFDYILKGTVKKEDLDIASEDFDKYIYLNADTIDLGLFKPIIDANKLIKTNYSDILNTNTIDFSPLKPIINANKLIKTNYSDILNTNTIDFSPLKPIINANKLIKTNYSDILNTNTIDFSPLKPIIDANKLIKTNYLDILNEIDTNSNSSK